MNQGQMHGSGVALPALQSSNQKAQMQQETYQHRHSTGAAYVNSQTIDSTTTSSQRQNSRKHGGFHQARGSNTQQPSKSKANFVQHLPQRDNLVAVRENNQNEDVGQGPMSFNQQQQPKIFGATFRSDQVGQVNVNQNSRGKTKNFNKRKSDATRGSFLNDRVSHENEKFMQGYSMQPTSVSKHTQEGIALPIKDPLLYTQQPVNQMQKVAPSPDKQGQMVKTQTNYNPRKNTNKEIRVRPTRGKSKVNPVKISDNKSRMKHAGSSKQDSQEEPSNEDTSMIAPQALSGGQNGQPSHQAASMTKIQVQNRISGQARLSNQQPKLVDFM